MDPCARWCVLDHFVLLIVTVVIIAVFIVKIDSVWTSVINVCRRNKWEDNIVMDLLRKSVGGFKLDLCGSEYRPVADSLLRTW